MELILIPNCSVLYLHSSDMKCLGEGHGEGDGGGGAKKKSGEKT